MMTIAHEKGSKEFLRPLKKLAVPAKIGRLRFADFSFTGNGPHGRVRVGVERKRVGEIVGRESYKRFKSHQLPGLLTTYDYAIVIVEGDTHVGGDGILKQGLFDAGGFSGDAMTYEQYHRLLMTLAFKSGVRLALTKTKTETGRWLAACYGWWQKEWSNHRSAYAVEEQNPDHVLLEARVAARQTYAQWPAIGWARSRGVFDHFGEDIVRAVTASPREWTAVTYKDRKGKSHRMGPNRAATIVAFLNGRMKNHGAKG